MTDLTDLTQLEEILPAYIRPRRWFGAKTRAIEGVRIVETVRVPLEGGEAQVSLVQLQYGDGGEQLYVLPLASALGEEAERIGAEMPHAVVTREAGGIIYDASADPRFALALLDLLAEGQSLEGGGGEIKATATEAFRRILPPDSSTPQPRVGTAEQSNTSIIFGDRFILKLFRRLEMGTSPDLEIGRFLTRQGFPHTPALAGALEYVKLSEGEPMTLAILQGFVPNRGDAWSYTLNGLLGGKGDEIIRSAELLGKRTAEMHAALSSDPTDNDFAPESLTPAYAAHLHASISELAETAFAGLSRRLEELPEGTRREAESVLERTGEIEARLESLVEAGGRDEWAAWATLTRCHGDYHLGQVLYTGDDFVIIDFEGEPARSLEERRGKHSPLKDVAGMLRSYHYAAYAALLTEGSSLSEEFVRGWYAAAAQAYTQGYNSVPTVARLLPATPHDLDLLLDLYRLEKAIYELLYELNNRPDWVRIPLGGIMHLLASGPRGS
jgi:trehalose synthase-fused probable maltokinase